MTYALSAPLQSAIFARLAAAADLTAIVGDAIFDAVPYGTVPPTYVTIGDETVRDRSDKDGGGAWHDFELSVVTEAAGFQTAKRAAAAICDAILGAEIGLERGYVVGVWFLKARAQRIGSNDQRRIDLRFRAHLQDN